MACWASNRAPSAFPSLAIRSAVRRAITARSRVPSGVESAVQSSAWPRWGKPSIEPARGGPESPAPRPRRLLLLALDDLAAFLRTVGLAELDPPLPLAGVQP